MNLQSNIRYGTGIALLLTAYVLDAVDRPVIQSLVYLIYAGLLALLVLDPYAPRWTRPAAILLVGLTVLTSVSYTVLQPQPGALGPFTFVLSATVIAVAIGVILHRIFSHKQVGLSTVMGAVLAYALLAFLFASIYQTIAIVNDTPFFNQGFRPVSDYLYFSFVTLTTLGYGDLSPALDLGKRLVVIEALLGQVFLVVLVARMVSMWRIGGLGDETEIETSRRALLEALPELAAMDRKIRSEVGSRPDDEPGDASVDVPKDPQEKPLGDQLPEDQSPQESKPG